MKIEHLGIAIKSLENSDNLFAKLLGKSNYKQESVEREGVTTSFYQLELKHIIKLCLILIMELLELVLIHLNQML